MEAFNTSCPITIGTPRIQAVKMVEKRAWIQLFAHALIDVGTGSGVGGWL